jgi:hypothetical protein
MPNLAEYRRSSTHLTDMTAKAPGVTVPLSLPGRADQVIE